MILSFNLLLRDGIQELIPYPIEEHPYRIKLDANESPFAIDWTQWPEVMNGLRHIQLNRYPDPHARKIKRALASYLKWPADKMILGNGSDELIQYIIMAFGGPKRLVYAPHPSFSMYRIISVAMGQEFRRIQLGEGFELPSDQALMEELSDETQKIVFIASPNNPTGNCFNREGVLSIITHTNGLVCVDEAYHDFSDDDGFLDCLEEFKNLIILRTLSKIGLAGLRVGILLANDEIIHAISKVRLPFNLNVVSQYLAQAVLDHRDLIFEMNKTVKENRVWLAEQMRNIKGIKVFPSQANFILFSTKWDIESIYQALLSEGVLIRMFPPDEKWPGFFRVTVGTRKECETFVLILKKILSIKEETNV